MYVKGGKLVFLLPLMSLQVGATRLARSIEARPSIEDMGESSLGYETVELAVFRGSQLECES